MLRNLLTAACLAFLISACAGPKAASSQANLPYPLDECLVTDNELGSMGDPIVMVYKGQEVKFCCEPCVEEFEANPDMFLSKITEK